MNVIIVGGGEIGAYLGRLLLADSAHLRMIESRHSQAERLKQTMPPETVVWGNGTVPAVLEAAGIRQADVVAAVTGLDETNLVVMSLARFTFHVPRTVARVNIPSHAWMFTPAMGVDIPLNQADLMAHLIVEEISLGNLMTLLKLQRGAFSLVEEAIQPDAPAAGKEIKSLPLPEACVLTAVIRRGQLLIPRGNTVLQPGDEVLAVVHSTALNALSALLGGKGAKG
jgi:trk system potassium uptake protein TrkA